MEPGITVTILPSHPFDTAPHSELGYGKKGRDGSQVSTNAYFISLLLSRGIFPPVVPSHLMTTLLYKAMQKWL